MATDDEVADAVEDETTSGGTLDEDYRWKYLSTCVTLVTVTGYIVLVLGRAFGYTQSQLTGGTWATFTMAFLAVIAYSIGPSMVEQAAKAKGA